MSLETRDGFKFLRYIDGRMFLSVESNRLDACIAYCRKKKVRHLHISPYHGYRRSNLDFLEDCPHVTGVHLQDGTFDLSGLYSLRDLSQLSAVFDLRQELDLGRFPRLADLSADWHPTRLANLTRCPLTRLWLRKYKPPTGDLAALGDIRPLESLQLIQCTASSLAGLDRLPLLWEFEAHYCARLRDVSSLAALKDTLQRLRLDHCKSVEDRESVTRLHRLTHLSFSHARPLPSLAFIRRMPKLRFFAFVGTDVTDGDMTPLLALSYAGFDCKRHFSHSFEQVQRLIAARGAPAVGTWTWGMKTGEA